MRRIQSVPFNGLGPPSPDHLDVIGHFDDRGAEPQHYDWLSSGSGFKHGEFELLWRKVADFISGIQIVL